MIPQPTDDLLERVSRDFDLFARVSEPDARARAAFTQDLEEQAKRTAAAAARLFQTPDGVEVLEHLLDVSLRRPVFTAALGLAAEQAYAHGCLREGQNSLAWHLLTLIAKGRKDPQPNRGTEGI